MIILTYTLSVMQRMRGNSFLGKTSSVEICSFDIGLGPIKKSTSLITDCRGNLIPIQCLWSFQRSSVVILIVNRSLSVSTVNVSKSRSLVKGHKFIFFCKIYQYFSKYKSWKIVLCMVGLASHMSLRRYNLYKVTYYKDLSYWVEFVVNDCVFVDIWSKHYFIFQRKVGCI